MSDADQLNQCLGLGPDSPRETTCAKCGDDQQPPLGWIAMRGQFVCEACRDGDADYWRERALAAEAALRATIPIAHVYHPDRDEVEIDDRCSDDPLAAFPEPLEPYESSELHGLLMDLGEIDRGCQVARLVATVRAREEALSAAIRCWEAMTK